MTTKKTITVVQGDHAVSSDQSVVLTTVLGSCVAACLFDPSMRIGGMNHFLLAGSGSSRAGDMRYGVNAMELLINRLLQAGAQRHLIVAKLFGGASMTDHAGDIGKANAAFAIDFYIKKTFPVSRKVSEVTWRAGSNSRHQQGLPASCKLPALTQILSQQGLPRRRDRTSPCFER